MQSRHEPLAMGIYADRILPAMIDLALRGEEHTKLRRRFLREVHGRVLELGFGSGLNLPCYPAGAGGVTELVGLDPVKRGRVLARRRIAAAPFPVGFAELTGADFDVPDASFDCVTSTWTLCTVPDPLRTLAEVRRVLRPGGTFHFLEHGLAPRPRVARWQRRLTPVQKLWAGGCTLDRRMDELIAHAGFRFRDLERFYMKGPPIFCSMYGGVAEPIG